jgi:hypothetical protein
VTEHKAVKGPLYGREKTQKGLCPYCNKGFSFRHDKDGFRPKKCKHCGHLVAIDGVDES